MIIDDHPLFCDALSLTVKMVTSVKDPQTAKSLAEGLALLDDGLQPDVIMLDLNLPDVSGLDGLLRILARKSDQRVLIVSSMSENNVIRACVAAGAAGFVPKHSNKEVFEAAFNTLQAGSVFWPPGYTEATSETDKNVDISRLSSLTRQQARILRLMSEGKLNKQIAFDLTISEATVKAHITAILRKLNVQNRTQAVLASQRASFGNLSQPQGAVD